MEGGPLSHGLTLEQGRAIAQGRAPAPSQPAVATLSALQDGRAANPVDADPPSVPLRNGKLVLRVMPDDNSCLFRALGTAILGNALDSAMELRSIVTSAITSQPDVYTEAVLQKSPAAYCQWIMHPDTWGGYIETKAVAEHFGLEVVTLDVKTGLATRYNEVVGAVTRKRCFIVYSGIHYDVLAFEPAVARGAGGGEMDQYQFDTKDEKAFEAAEQVAKLLKGRNYYTDTSSFAIQCKTCGWAGAGEKDAREHARQTGHMRFEQADD
jgi:ubiquitin thioesterase OTU1